MFCQAFPSSAFKLLRRLQFYRSQVPGISAVLFVTTSASLLLAHLPFLQRLALFSCFLAMYLLFLSLCSFYPVFVKCFEDLRGDKVLKLKLSVRQLAV